MSDGMGAVPNALSFTDICAYADRFHMFTPDEFAVFFEYITFLDKIALEDATEKIKKERDKASNKSKGPSRGRS